jgi:hypothetical protein
MGGGMLSFRISTARGTRALEAEPGGGAMRRRAVVVVLAGLFAFMAAGVAGAVPASGPEIDDALAVFSGVMSGTTLVRA